MTFFRLLRRNLVYHWRGNLALFLGMMLGTAVLTGALLVGDSLEGSLRDLVLEQLGWVDQALVGGRFFRAEMASQLGADPVCPAILLKGAASSGHSGDIPSRKGSKARVGRISILGVTERFGLRIGNDTFWDLDEDQVVLNATLAKELGVKAGDPVTLHLQKFSAVPRETLLGRRETSDVLEDLDLNVWAVIPDEGLGRFSLNPSASVARNAFVPLSLLQKKIHQEGRVNALLIGKTSAPVREELLRQLKLEDWGLQWRDPESRAMSVIYKLDPRGQDGSLSRPRWRGRIPEDLAKFADDKGVLKREQIVDYYRRHHGYLSLESRQMLLEDAVVKAAQEAARETNLTAAPTLVYLADTIASGGGQIPYSVVAALDPNLPPPLGPFLPEPGKPLGDEEILLADWPESSLKAQVGDKVTLSYYQVEDQGRLEPKTADFTLRGKVPLQGAGDDPDLTPEFPGITDRLDMKKWEQPPFPYLNQRIHPEDERYWNRYRTTPKAYVTLQAGQKLWGSRFGQVTSIRLAPVSGDDLAGAAEKFQKELLSRLSPEQGGFVFDPVRERGLAASSQGSEFSMLFLAFSMFLIAAALLLVGLLFRLNLDRRASEVGLLMAVGYRRSYLRRLLLTEGGLLAILGGWVGSILAVGYAWLLLNMLAAWWPGALDRSFLRLHATLGSFLIGYVAALLVSMLTIAWAIRLLGKVSPRALLAGEVTGESELGQAARPGRRSLWVAGIGAVAALALVAAGGFVKDHELRAMTFFGSGAFLLIAGLASLWAWMHATRQGQVTGHGGIALGRLGVRNSSRHAVRSLLTVGLLASATFLIVAVESFHRNAIQDVGNRDSGTGGFPLIAESNLPIFQDFNNLKDRKELLGPEPVADTLKGVSFYPFRLQAGDDASCLNLYQPRRPRLLGVPRSLIEEEHPRFHFQDSEATAPEDKANPWRLLEQPRSDGAIPVIGDATTVQWILKSKLGGEIEVPNEKGERIRLRIVGLLADSIFQSELLLCEANFLRLYPNHEGYHVFLIDAPPQQEAAVKDLLEGALASAAGSRPNPEPHPVAGGPREGTLSSAGLEVTPTAQRMEAFLNVENTYLLTFQALGGLGLLLGAVGLAIVLLRSVWERRGELALLRALGFRRAALGWLVLAENCFLLLVGLGIGLITALLAVAPHLLGGTGEVPWLRLWGLLGLVLVVGLAAGTAAVAATLRAPLLPALRNE